MKFDLLDRESLRLFLWAPPLLATGIGIFFWLKIEPPLWPTLLALVITLIMELVIYWRARHRWLAWPALLLVLGFGAAQLETRLSATPMLDRDIGFTSLTGQLVDIDPLPDGRRLLIAPDHIERLEGPMPSLIRLTDKKAAGLLVSGQAISLHAYVRAVAPPVLPQSFDFRRYAYFNHIGASGFVTGTVTVNGTNDSWRARLMLLFADLRLQLQARINQVLQGDEAAIAGALLTGAQNSISDPTMSDMRLSGVTHILSVSGLHIGLAAGLLFFLIRALLALSPTLAQRWPIKKWAAGLSWFGALAYTLFVGAPAPAVRSLLMIGFGLLAIVVDRTPLSLRVVALSAILILIVSPHVLLGPSFQLSYAAIVGIIGLYEMTEPWRERLKARDDGPLLRGLRALGAVIATSLAASIATMPLLHYHFQQLSFYGVLANLLAIPLTSLWLMPAALPFAALMLITLGFLWLMIWQQRWRWWGMLPITIGSLLAFFPLQPQLLVSGDGRFAAIKRTDGNYVLAMDTDRRHMDGYIPEAWQNWLGEHPFKMASCDAVACKENGFTFVRDPNALAMLCNATDDWIIAPSIPVRNCGEKLIDSRFLRHNGGLTMDAKGDIETVRDTTGDRPWSLYETSEENPDQ